MKAVLLVFVFAAVIGCCYASRDHWVRLNEVPSDVETRFTIALKQHNLNIFSKLFEEISTPQSSKYGQHLGISEIADILAPAPQDVRTVVAFLKAESPKAVIRTHIARDALLVIMPTSDVERIFQVTMARFQNKHSARVITRSDKMYTLPSEIAQYIDMISMISDFPASKVSIKSSGPNAADVSNAPVYGYPQASDTVLYAQVTPVCKGGQVTKNPTNPCADFPPAITSFQTYVVNNWTSEAAGNNKILTPITNGACALDGASVSCNFVFNEYPVIPYDLYTISIVSNYADGSSSDVSVFPTALVTSAFVTPQLLWQQYKAPLSYISHGANQSVAEFGAQYYSPTDLQYFLGNMSLPTAPTSVVGPNKASTPGDEATLDIQWIMAAAPGAATVFWSVGHDEYLYEWALQVQQSPNRPLVHSISYAGNEGGSPLVWRQRVDVELQKLGALGLSVVVASGDAGATDVGHGFDACTPLQPQYPSGSSYVTSVSATFFTPKAEPICYNNFMEAPIHCSQKYIGEVAVAANIGMDWTTGGGFSNSSARPSWQNTAVSDFLKKNPSAVPPSSYFNANGRAYPDVSAVGHNLVIIIDDHVDVADGTSAATPIFAGFLTRINDFLLANNKPPLGFANPLLYQVAAAYPQAFYDVTVGSNNCGDVLHPPYIACCPYGYQATQGWDPVTGLGTPVFDNLIQGVAKILGINV